MKRLSSKKHRRHCSLDIRVTDMGSIPGQISDLFLNLFLLLDKNNENISEKELFFWNRIGP